MNKYLKFVKVLTRRVGVEVNLYNIYSSDFLHLKKLLAFHKIKTIIDVGANTGQYAMNIRDAGFEGKIISFEPLSDAYRQLRKNSRKDDKWVVADRMALGNEDGKIEINCSANLVSSSVLPIKESHVKAAPESAYVKKEAVLIRRLDSIAKDLDLSGNIYIKIDVQGFELDVLKGAATLLTEAKGLQLELSLVELYEGQLLMEEMLRYVESLGFVLHALFPAFIDESSGRMLQADGVFFKRKQ